MHGCAVSETQALCLHRRRGVWGLLMACFLCCSFRCRKTAAGVDGGVPVLHAWAAPLSPHLQLLAVHGYKGFSTGSDWDGFIICLWLLVWLSWCRVHRLNGTTGSLRTKSLAIADSLFLGTQDAIFQPYASASPTTI